MNHLSLPNYRSLTFSKRLLAIAAVVFTTASAQAQIALYDTTGGTFAGISMVPGGAAAGITRLVADKITFNSPAATSVTQVLFTLVNNNATAPTFRPRLRFWFDNAGTPGAYYNDPANVGFSFAPLSVLANTSTTFTGTLGAGSFNVPAGVTTIWYGITFDNVGATATEAELNNLGVGVFSGAIVGSSDDAIFTTTAAGSFFGTSNPAGAVTNLTPGQNLGLGLTTALGAAPEPGSLVLLLLGASSVLVRRKRQ